MYSAVLMTALVAGGATPDCWRHGGCGGCYGGGCYGGCWGAAYSCYGCTGCYGGGGCGGCGGGYGSGYGYGGGYSYGGYGSCYGGCWGSCYGCHGCYGCYGCYGCHGASGWAGAVVVPGGPSVVPEMAPAPKPVPAKETSALPTKAKVVVEVPANAKLYIDDQLTKTTSTTRVFNTPELKRGETYYYDVRVEVTKDGQTYTDHKRLVVKAGQEVRETFADLGTSSRPGATVTASVRPQK